ncbi:hypothetical protein CSUI_007587, partial [Cystoisospora suis]
FSLSTPHADSIDTENFQVESLSKKRKDFRSLIHSSKEKSSSSRESETSLQHRRMHACTAS